jgi:hypothetical protein
VLAEHHGVAISAPFRISEAHFKFWFQKVTVLAEIHSILTWLTMLTEFLCYFLKPKPPPPPDYDILGQYHNICNTYTYLSIYHLRSSSYSALRNQTK